MRLRLRIERNGLPPTHTLWPVDSTNTRLTIAQLVQKINETFPLEYDTWGLEDYAVSIGGYDCLHYHELNQVCKDDDEVVVRPLQWADVRARTLNGRSQISSDGRRLVDGIPFGKEKVREGALSRPDVRIPPRKRRRLNTDMPIEDVAADEDTETSDDEEDADFEEEIEEADDDTSSLASSGDDVSSSDDDDSSSEDDSDDSSSSDSSDDESWDGLSPVRPPSPVKKPSESLPNRASESERTPSSTTTSKRKRELDQQASINEVSSSNIISSLPGQGRPETKSRNIRRRDAGRLKRLKETGVLPPDATMAMMRELDAKKQAFGGGDVEIHAPEAQAETTNVGSSDNLVPDEQTGQPKDIIREEAKSTTAKKQRGSAISEDDEFQRRRLKLLADIDAGGVDVSRPSSRKPPQTLDQSPSDAAVKNKAEAMLGAASPSTAPRARLNLATSNRLVFGSLGVRVPKTQQEKDALQKKLAQRASSNPNNLQAVAASPSTDDAAATVQLNTELDTAQATAAEASHWSLKINLTAVECCEEGVTLSTPPFPFYQRWDPQQKKSKKRTSTLYMQKGKAGRKRNHVEFEETYDKYNSNGGGDALDYDDLEGDNEEYWEDGALLDNTESGMDVEDGAEEEENDVDSYPDLPTNTDSLPALSESEARAKDFVVFSELACDQSTDWQPKMTTRTAQIISQHEDRPDSKSWVLSMSERDRPRKVFDDEGNRVYKKFEMPESEDEDDEVDGTRTVEWTELGEVRLLLRPSEQAAA